MEDHDIDAAFWQSQVEVANRLSILVVAINLTYALVTLRTGPNRPLLVVVNLLALAAIAASARGPRIETMSTARRDLVLGSSAVFGPLVVVLAASLDGGVNSPMVWLLPISVMFTTMTHRPRVVLICAAVSVGGFLLLAATMSEGLHQPAALAVRSAYLALLSYAGARAAQTRWNQHDARVVLTHRLAALADHDGLTGLLNHRAFQEQLATSASEAERDATPLTVVVADLDHFKRINDQHGHPTGDLVLASVAQAIRSVVSATDAICARIGGEEFCLALPRTDSLAGALLAERLRAAISAARVLDVRFTISVGVSSYPRDTPVAGLLLDCADKALYVAKGQGRDRVCVSPDPDREPRS